MANVNVNLNFDVNDALTSAINAAREVCCLPLDTIVSDAAQRATRCTVLWVRERGCIQTYLLVLQIGQREAALRAVVEMADHMVAGRCNIMICSLGHEHKSEWITHGFKAFDVVGLTYGLWLVDSGYFKNLGDGGYRN